MSFLIHNTILFQKSLFKRVLLSPTLTEITTFLCIVRLSCQCIVYSYYTQPDCVHAFDTSILELGDGLLPWLWLKKRDRQSNFSALVRHFACPCVCTLRFFSLLLCVCFSVYLFSVYGNWFAFGN